jgi:hypothetical protein
LLPERGAQAAPKAPVDSDWGVRQGRPITAPGRAVGLFVLLTICLSGIFWVLINAIQTVNAAYIFGLMWMPAAAAILTCRIFLGRPLRTLGLGTWNGRYVLIGYLVRSPIAWWHRSASGASVSANFRIPSLSGRPLTLSGWARHPTGW